VGPTFYLDQTATQFWRTDYWYYVTAVNTLLVESAQSSPVVNYNFAKVSNQGLLTQLGNQLDMNHLRILQEMVRRDELMLRRGGETVNYYVRRTSGTHCDCFVSERGQTADPNCPNCYGTSFNPGYDKYANVLMKIEPYAERGNLMEEGFKKTSTPRSWVTTFPLVRAGDVVVRTLYNRRYEVQNENVVLSRGVILRQEFDLMEMTLTQVPELFALT
jgi:hypothetical protein